MANFTMNSHFVRDANDCLLGIVWGPRDWCERLPYLATRHCLNDRGQLTNEECSFASKAEAIAYAKSGEY